MRIGTTAIKMPAACPVLLLANWPWKFNSPTGMVLFASELNKIRAKRNSFQVATASRMNTVTRAGVDSGRIRVKKIRQGPAPSILAASMSSSGSCRQNEYLERDAEREVRTYQTRNTVNGSHGA